MTFISTRRALAAIVAAACLAIPAPASAMPYSPPSTTKSDDPQSSADGKTIASPARPRSALAQERYYSSYLEPVTIDAGTSAAQAQERYHASYGEPEPLTLAQSPAPSDDTPWLPIALSIAVVLALAAASAIQLGRLRVRRRAPRSVA